MILEKNLEQGIKREKQKGNIWVNLIECHFPLTFYKICTIVQSKSYIYHYLRRFQCM